MGAQPWVAHSQHDYGRTLLARGSPKDADRAQTLLRAARDAYQSLGMTPWVARVADEPDH